MANENSIDVYHALMALEEKVKGVAPDPENVTTDVALALADIFRTDAPMAQETAIVNAIDTITANYGGGGGGVDVGAPTRIAKGDKVPEAGDYLNYGGPISGLAVGNATIVPDYVFSQIGYVAAGVTATTALDMELRPTDCDAYVVTVDDEAITAAEEWDGTLTPGTVTAGPATLNVWTFDVPALTFDEATLSGQALYLYMH